MIAALVRLLHGRNNDRIHGYVGSQSVHFRDVSNKICLIRFPLDIEYYIFNFCSVREMVYMDSAMTNRLLRKHFHKSLHGFVIRGPVNFMFVEWFRSRRCFLDDLVVTSPIESLITVRRTINKITELTIRGAADVSAVRMFCLLAECENLQRLNVGNFPRFQVSYVATLSRPLNLLELNLSGNNCVDNGTVVALLEKCPHLHVLHANDCFQLGEPILRALTKHCVNLQEIHFNWCKEREMVQYARNAPIIYDPNSCYSQFFRACQQLKIVVFEADQYHFCGGNITPLDVFTLGKNCTHLTHVHLSAPLSMFSQRDRTDQLDIALIQLAQTNPLIVSLTLEHFQKISNLGLDAIADNLGDLHTFTLRRCGPGGLVGKEGLLNIRTRCVKLTTFDVNDVSYLVLGKPGMLHTLKLDVNLSDHMNDATLVHVAQHNYNLQTFCGSHYYMKRMTNVGLCVALSHWHNLRCFEAVGDHGYAQSAEFGVSNHSVSNSQVINDSVLYALTQNCPLLTTLNISGNTKLTNAALCEIAKLVHLKTLKALSCKLIENTALIAIALACQCLVNIEISRCNITDTAIRALARYGSQKLQHISICECPRLHNDSIRLLIRSSRQLRYLRLWYFRWTRVSFRAVSQLPQYCPYMESLDIAWMGYSWRWAYRQNKHNFDAILAKRRRYYTYS